MVISRRNSAAATGPRCRRRRPVGAGDAAGISSRRDGLGLGAIQLLLCSAPLRAPCRNLFRQPPHLSFGYGAEFSREARGQTLVGLQRPPIGLTSFRRRESSQLGDSRFGAERRCVEPPLRQLGAVVPLPRAGEQGALALAGLEKQRLEPSAMSVGPVLEGRRPADIYALEKSTGIERNRVAVLPPLEQSGELDRIHVEREVVGQGDIRLAGGNRIPA